MPSQRWEISVLLYTMIRVLSFVSSSRSSSCASSAWLLSSTTITSCASEIACKLRRIPICSTTSSVSRIPAVSIRFRVSPCKWICPSTISRVVPAISVTIAFSSSSSAFKRLLFPTFGLPTIAVLMPSFNS